MCSLIYFNSLSCKSDIVFRTIRPVCTKCLCAAPPGKRLLNLFHTGQWLR